MFLFSLKRGVRKFSTYLSLLREEETPTFIGGRGFDDGVLEWLVLLSLDSMLLYLIPGMQFR